MQHRLSIFAAAIGAMIAAPATAQTTQDVDKFLKLVQSYDYEKLIGGKVIETDQQMAPPCNSERKIEGHQIVAILRPPQFVETRAVPVAGEWRERVVVSRCGKQVRHNVFLFASRVRGLHAVVAFPGESRADVDMQAQIGRQVLAAARKTNPSCKRLDIVDTNLREKDAASGQPWTEIWTSWVCGVLTYAEVRYTPKPAGGVDFRVR